MLSITKNQEQNEDFRMARFFVFPLIIILCILVLAVVHLVVTTVINTFICLKVITQLFHVEKMTILTNRIKTFVLH